MTAIDFFVSYDQADRVWAEWVGWQLEDAGYSVRLRAWDHELPGGNRVLGEDRDLGLAKRLIAVMSPSYRLSVDTQRQWSAFLRRDPSGDHRQIIPVEVEPTTNAALLGNLAAVRLYGLAERAAVKTLLDAVKATRLKPSHPPGFPGQPGAHGAGPGFPGVQAGQRANPGLRPDTIALLTLIAIDVALFFYGYLAYTGGEDQRSDFIRSVSFIFAVGITIRTIRRWWIRRF